MKKVTIFFYDVTDTLTYIERVYTTGRTSTYTDKLEKSKVVIFWVGAGPHHQLRTLRS